MGVWTVPTRKSDANRGVAEMAGLGGKGARQDCARRLVLEMC